LGIVTSISSTKKNTKRYVVFIDGKFAFSISDFVLAKYKIKEGLDLSHELIHKILFEENLEYLKQRALDLVSRRPRSEREITNKLENLLKKRISKFSKLLQNDKDISKLLIQETLYFLKKYDYLDDLKFANWIVEQRLNQKKGPLFIKQDLYKKGVNKEIINEALSLIDTSKSIEKSYKQALKKYKNEINEYKKKQKIYSYLMRQGFSYDDIKALFDDFE